MTLTELRNKADAKLATFWAKLQVKQDAYFAKHGKYFQVLFSPIPSVIDGVDTPWELRNPTDEAFIQDVELPSSDTVPYQIQVTEWTGDTPGYEAAVWVQLPNGRQFERRRNSNQEDTGWNELLVTSA